MTFHQKHHLLLMRHGKSDWYAGTDSDFDRPLTKRGSTDVRKVSRWMATHGLIPDQIVSSTATRTRETANQVIAGLQLNRDLVHWDDDIYEATREQLLAVLGRYLMNCRCLLLIGHNPGLDSLVGWLSDSEPDRTASGKLMTTSALAILARGDEAIGLARHSLQLLRIVRPKELD